MSHSKENSLSPFLKWAGGKRQLLPAIKKEMPKKFNVYCEPFVGAGALFLNLELPNIIINDINSELINCYKVIKRAPIALIKELESYKNTEEFFYEIRNLGRDKKYNKLSSIKKAARMIFLNKTCFNGLYRVNKSGYFNVPFGRYKNPTIVDKDSIMAISKYLNGEHITILNKNFAEATNSLKKGDFVYFDPPYQPLTKTSSFTSYTSSSFTEENQKELKLLVDKLSEKGVFCLISNSCCDFIKELYRDYTVIEIDANRSINSDASKRQKIKEVLIKNY